MRRESWTPANPPKSEGLKALESALAEAKAKAGAWRNKLYYGDNLGVLRVSESDVQRRLTPIPNESVDLIYLDPPFNSQRNYNLLFKQQKGQDAPAQIMAFEDTWEWSPLAYKDFQCDPRNEPLWKVVASLYEILGKSEMMAYVVMMAPRLLELHRKLKATGSLYLHCDPVASHYLKIILDVIFGPTNFRNEIVWKRTDSHNDASKQFGRTSDRLLLYMKTSGALSIRSMCLTPKKRFVSGTSTLSSVTALSGR